MIKKLLDQDEWLVIINPNAGNGRGRKDWKKISNILETNGIRFHEYFTSCKGDGIRLSNIGLCEGYRKIISIGGDGTLNEILNGICSQNCCPTNQITLALIPVGTGNDWGKMFGITSDYYKAVEIIMQNRQLLHDICTISYYNGDIQEKRYFLNIAGLGFESVVVRKTNRQKEKGWNFKALYFLNILTSMLFYKNTHAKVMVGDRIIEDKVFSINVGNGLYCGGGMRQTPDAIPTDGILNVTIIKNISKLDIIRNLHILYDGTILSHPKIEGHTGKKITVTSDSLLYTESDGESLGHTPAEFEIIPAALKIVYGKNFTQQE